MENAKATSTSSVEKRDRRSDVQIVFNQDGRRTELRCPFSGCGLPDMTHLVDVKWELDPDEGDRKRVRLEIRCEDGHGFLLYIKNHAGYSYIQWQPQPDNVSPLGEDRKW